MDYQIVNVRIISHPEIVQRIHKEYEAAGCQFITTNTFGSSPLKLEDYDLQDKVEVITEAAVKNAREACSSRVKIAGDMGPTGRFLSPLGDLSFDEACENYYRLAKALANAGADCLIIETIIGNEGRTDCRQSCVKPSGHLPDDVCRRRKNHYRHSS